MPAQPWLRTAAAAVVVLLLSFQVVLTPAGAAATDLDPALEQLVHAFAPAGFEPAAEPQIPRGPLSNADLAATFGMTSPLAADGTAVTYVANWQDPNCAVLLTLAASQYSPNVAQDDLAAFSSSYRDRGAGRIPADGADVVAWSSFDPSPLTAVGFARGNRTVVVFVIGDANSSPPRPTRPNLRRRSTRSQLRSGQTVRWPTRSTHSPTLLGRSCSLFASPTSSSPASCSESVKLLR